MVKVSHEELIEVLAAIGAKLGFLVAEEFEFCFGKHAYMPRFDLIWFLEMPFLGHLGEMLPETPYIYKHKGRFVFPYAIFEITGVDATTKTIQTEIANIALARAKYGFVIVPSRKEKPGQMHVARARRALDIVMEFGGWRDICVLGHDDVLKLRGRDVIISGLPPEHMIAKQPRGLPDLINNLLSRADSNIVLRSEYRPDIALGYGRQHCLRSLQLPRLDYAFIYVLNQEVAAGVNWFLSLIPSAAFYGSPGAIDLLGVEVERTRARKHVAGSIRNLHFYTYLGVVLTNRPDVVQRIIDAYGYGSHVFALPL